MEIEVLERFQSHAGSIEATDVASPQDSKRPCFNPTLVRLRLTGWRGWLS